MTADLQAGDSLGQMTITICMIGLAFGQFVAGPVSDRLGRRRPLLVGLVAFCLLSAACAFAPSLPVLIALRFLGGVAGGVGVVISRAVVRDVYEGRDIARIFSLLMLISSTAPVVAPLLGAVLLRFLDWRGLFLAVAALGAFILFVSVTVIPETLMPAKRNAGSLRHMGQGMRDVIKDPLFVASAVVLTAAGAGTFTYISGSSFVLQGEYGLTPQQFSLVFGVNAVGVILVGLLNAVLVRTIAPRTLLIWGSAIAAGGALACFICALTVHELMPVLVTLFVSVASCSLVAPNATALAMQGQGERAGAASALVGTGPFVVGPAVAPLASLWGASMAAMALVLAVMLLTSLVLSLLAIRPPKLEKKAAQQDPHRRVDGSAGSLPDL